MKYVGPPTMGKTIWLGSKGCAGTNASWAATGVAVKTRRTTPAKAKRRLHHSIWGFSAKAELSLSV
jgi:hypothetical protein